MANILALMWKVALCVNRYRLDRIVKDVDSKTVSFGNRKVTGANMDNPVVVAEHSEKGLAVSLVKT